MSTVLDQVLAANAAYAQSFGARTALARAPARRFAILTCMDARIDPAGFAGLHDGDANVIRNAGGRASDDVIRSLLISYKLLGTAEWFVVHHTECGLESATNESLQSLFAGSPEAAEIDWLPIASQTGSVVDDVRRIRNHPLVPARIAIYGFIYDVHSGQMIEVPEAMAVGAAAPDRPGR
jgi:carbonic anhydrase